MFWHAQAATPFGGASLAGSGRVMIQRESSGIAEELDLLHIDAMNIQARADPQILDRCRAGEICAQHGHERGAVQSFRERSRQFRQRSDSIVMVANDDA